MAKKEKKEEVVLKKETAPEKKGDINPGNMKVYIETYGTADDKRWFKEQCIKYKKDTNPKYGVDETQLRNVFIEKFYKGQYDKETTKSKFWGDINQW